MRNIFLVSAFILSACGDEDKGLFNRKKETKYSYAYSENGCETGRQTFKSKKSYCKGLKDEARNKGCAYETRMRTYEQACL